MRCGGVAVHQIITFRGTDYEKYTVTFYESN